MSVKFDFTGKVAFVTGAGSGIGRAAALAFGKANASVVVVGDADAPTQETVQLIEVGSGRAIAVCADVSNEKEVKAAIERGIDAFGRLDFALNIAGVEQHAAAAAEISSDEWERQINTNLSGVFFSMKHEIAAMLKTGGGVIVNTASGAAVKGFPKQAAYCAAKFGVVGLTKAAALDYAHQGIRVNVVSPGMIDTPMMKRFTGGTEEGRQEAVAAEPIGRVGRPEEIAGTMLWLCSDAAAFIVGANFVVDGGQTT